MRIPSVNIEPMNPVVSSFRRSATPREPVPPGSQVDASGFDIGALTAAVQKANIYRRLLANDDFAKLMIDNENEARLVVHMLDVTKCSDIELRVAVAIMQHEDGRTLKMLKHIRSTEAAETELVNKSKE